MTRRALKIAIPPRDDNDTTLLDSDTKRNLIVLIVRNINSDHAHRIDTLLHQIHRQATLETELANYTTPHDQTQDVDKPDDNHNQDSHSKATVNTTAKTTPRTSHSIATGYPQ